MDAITVLLAVFSALGAGFGSISLVFHWVRRKEPVEVSELRAELHQVQRDYLDLVDKVEHWIKRERVRRVREGAEAKQAQEQVAMDLSPDMSLFPNYSPPSDRKAALRARLRAKQLDWVPANTGGGKSQ